MSRRRIVPWVLACAVGAAGAAFVLTRGHFHLDLPPAADYPTLPAAFARALHDSRERAGERSADPAAVRKLAHLYQANRLFPEARACYRLMKEILPGLSARDHYDLAAIAQDESDLELAEQELRATLVEEPGYLPARLALAQVLFKTGQSDKAKTEFESLRNGDPNNPDANLGLARIELQEGRDDEAVTRLSGLVAGHPEAGFGAALLAQVLERKGKASEAAAMAARSRQVHDPAPPDPWRDALLADCYNLQTLELAFEEYRLAGQLDEALPLLDRLEELDPDGWIPPMLRGWSQKEAGRYPEAVTQYGLALQRGGDPDKICPLMAAAYLTEGDAAGAAAMLATYHEKSPHSIPILLSYSETAVRLKDDRLARSLLEQVLQAEPNLYLPNMSLVQILWASGERDAAAQCLLRVARVFPADVDSRGLLGQYYLEKSDAESAIPPLEQAVALAGKGHPKRERLIGMLDSAYLLDGSLQASQGHYAEAVASAEKSIALVPGGFRGLALEANASMRMRDFKRAREALGRLAALQPANPSVRMSLGDMEYQDGDREAARSDWQKAQQIAPADAAGLREAVARRLAGQFPPGFIP